MPRESRKAETRKRRRDRAEFGDFRKRLSVPKKVREWAERENKRLHYFNDNGARLQQAFQNDWNFVRFQGEQIGEADQPQANSDCYAVVVGKGEHGEPIKAYLMAKDQDWYEEDFRAKQKEVDEIDAAIRAGAVRKSGDRVESTDYVKEINYQPRAKLRP